MRHNSHNNNLVAHDEQLKTYELIFTNQIINKHNCYYRLTACVEISQVLKSIHPIYQLFIFVEYFRSDMFFK